MKSKINITIYIFLLAITLFFTACFQADRDNPNDPKADNYTGLLGNWNFEEQYSLPTGTETLDGKRVEDRSGIGNFGVFANSGMAGANLNYDTVSYPDLPGNTRSLSIGPNTQGKIEIENPDIFSFSNPDSKFTIEFFIKINGIPPTNSTPIISNWGFTAEDKCGWKIFITTGFNIGVRLSEDGKDLDSSCYACMSQGLGTGVWYHIVCTIDVEKDEYYIYINTVLNSVHSAGTMNTIDTIQKTGLKISIGSSAANEGTPNINIDEVKIYRYIKVP